MRWNTYAVALVLVLLLQTTDSQAIEPCRRILGCPVPDCIGKWCCDDYRPKCLPFVKVPFCFGCDDYCSKRLPQVCVPLCFGCDDYCNKCLPPVCKPPLLHTLRCIPFRSSCQCIKCVSPACDQVVKVEGDETANDIAKNLRPVDFSAILSETDSESTLQPVTVEIFNR